MNETTSLIKSYKGKNIRIDQSNNFVCLTDMALANSKQVGHWYALKGTQEYLTRFSETIGIPIVELIVVNEGRDGGTWAHQKIAIRFAQWCSVDFALQVDFWIDELMNTGKVELVSQRQLPPIRDTIEYIQVFQSCGLMDDPMIRSLITQRVCEELTSGSNTRRLASPEQPLNVTSIASNLGFSQQAIGNGSALGKYIASRHQPLGTSQHGKYQVNVYLPSEVESSIQTFFTSTLVLAN